ncbi:hypothetical protein K439DRAFT_245562 [Ramaria rubella]|nr:hypothetical protein K439DRAFT_245562 [Ramaria rubella]
MRLSLAPAAASVEFTTEARPFHAFLQLYRVHGYELADGPTSDKSHPAATGLRSRQKHTGFGSGGISSADRLASTGNINHFVVGLRD